MTEPTLYIVPTPLGNLSDLSERAKKTLENSDLIVCEDTRRTQILLSHFRIKGKSLISYFNGSELQKAASLVDHILKKNLCASLVSDGGTPCLSDPGYHLIQKAREKKLKIIPLPGPCAPITLASCAGLPTDRLLFIGFLPKTETKLREEIRSWLHLKGVVRTISFFETTKRLPKTLDLLWQEYGPDHGRLAIGRELTKLHEEIIVGDHQQIFQTWLESKNGTLKGEVTCLFTPRFEKPSLEDLKSQIKIRLKDLEKTSQKDLIKKLRDLYPEVPKKQLYQWLLEDVQD